MFNPSMFSSSIVNSVFFNPGLPEPIRTTLALNNSGDINAPVCLTFDDGPDPGYTQKILDLLADYHVKATFFVLGKAAAQFPHLLEQMIKAGHSIGNHTFSHPHPWMISSKHVKHEIERTTKIIKDITGIAPQWFRPPFGRLTTSMRMQAHTEQMTTVLWNRSIMDWGMFGTKTGIARRLDKIKPGDIVLMHDGRPGHNHPEVTCQCLSKFLQGLADKSLVTRNLDEVFSEKIDEVFLEKNNR
jgi:peptidoglycan/xylan/chitin deacetylase (PgdA/CDA1 family)